MEREDSNGEREEPQIAKKDHLPISLTVTTGVSYAGILPLKYSLTTYNLDITPATTYYYHVCYNCFCFCQVKFDEIRFQWRIENFDVMRFSQLFLSEQSFQLEFGASLGLPCAWRFVLSSLNHTGTDWLQVHRKLVRVPAEGMEISTTCSLKIQGRNGEDDVFYKRNSPLSTWKLDRTGIFGQVLRINDQDEDLPLIDNTLVLDIVMRMYVWRPPRFQIHPIVEENCLPSGSGSSSGGKRKRGKFTDSTD